jgi:hypothetical protein
LPGGKLSSLHVGEVFAVSFHEDVKKAFWNELRVYVMILPKGASMAQLLNHQAD